MIAQVLYSFIAIIFKTLTDKGLPVLQILFIRSAFVVAAAFTTRMLTRKGSFFGPKKLWPFLALRATVGPVGMLCYFASLPRIDVGDAIALSRLTPIFAVLIAFVLRLENLNYIMGIGALVCALGGVIITHPPIVFGGDGNHWTKETTIGYGLALTAAAMAGGSFLTTAKIGTAVSELTIIFSNHTPSVIWMGICLCFSFPSPPIWLTKETSLLFAVFLPAIFCANVALTRGVQLCKGVQAACLQCTGIIFSYVLAQVILGEKITVFAIVGTVVVCGGIWTQSIGKARAQAAKITKDLEAAANENEGIEQ